MAKLTIFMAMIFTDNQGYENSDNIQLVKYN